MQEEGLEGMITSERASISRPTSPSLLFLSMYFGNGLYVSNYGGIALSASYFLSRSFAI